MYVRLSKFYKYFQLLLLFILTATSAFAESIEEYKCDLMMRGYEFSNNGLSEAIIKKDKEAVELFIKADINVNLPDNEGYSALDRAIKADDKDAVILISLAGGQSKKTITEKNIKNENIKKEKPEITIVKVKQINTNNQDNEKNINEFCQAVNRGDFDYVASKAEETVYLNTLTEEGLAPLHYAVFNNNPAMVHLLLNKGADVNVLTDDGMTPLDISVLNNQKIIAKELLETGGALSSNVAEELIKFGCKAIYDEDFGLYDAEFSDIFTTMEKIINKIEEKK